MVVVKFFTPDANWTWYVTEASAITEEGDQIPLDGAYPFKDGGKVVDVLFFGLVDGMERELGYFSLSELSSVRGSLGLPIERDLYWDPKPLREVAPDTFRKHGVDSPEDAHSSL